MELNDIYLVTFSPTHTSKQVGEAIVRGIGGKKVTIVDCSLSSFASQEFPANSLVVFTAPVYGGHLPKLVYDRWKDLHTQGAMAAAVVVYGNRAYEHALIELDAWATQHGFKTIAAGTFIGEHSYSTEQHPIAAKRPNAEDIQVAEDFGKQIARKITVASDAGQVYPVNVRNIPRPKQSILSLLRFIYKLSKWRKSGVPAPCAPDTDAALCNACGKCAKVCPTSAITLSGKGVITHADRCIKCCACVKECPQQARHLQSPFAEPLSTCFNRPKENKILL